MSAPSEPPLGQRYGHNRITSRLVPLNAQAAGDAVVFQVNLAPVDLPHARHILPHQIHQWRGQVERIVLTVDTQPGSGRYSDRWQEHEPGFRSLLDGIMADESNVSVVDVDYSETVATALSEAFLGGHDVPVKDSYGAPFYAYLFGLMAAGSRYVLHSDADMLYGGGSRNWLPEAIALLRDHTDVLVAGPFPGPPTADGSIPDSVAARHAGSQRHGSSPCSADLASPALRFSHLSTRSFLIDLDRFRVRVGALRIEPTPPPRWSDRSPGAAPLEICLSRALHDHDLARIDLLGVDPGMWVLHPPYRTAGFLRDLPELIRRVESGDVPDGQRGDFDVNDSMVDWSAARRRDGRRRRRERVIRLASAAARAPGAAVRRRFALRRSSVPGSSENDDRNPAPSRPSTRDRD